MIGRAGKAAARASVQASALASIATYYSERIRQYGATPLGVDWSCVPTQEMRFVQLLKLCDFSDSFSLNDVGCGYGALLAHLTKTHPRHRIDYQGTDLSEDMIAAASRRWSRRRAASFSLTRDTSRTADYSLASGVFNVKLDATDKAWEQCIQQSLKRMRDDSRRGLAVNFIHGAACAGTRIPQLYYTNPEFWVTHCERHLGVDVETVTGYGLREFTLLMRCRD